MELAFKALADGTRRQIVRMVWGRELTAGEIASAFTMSAPAISQHLRVLLEAKLVSLRKAGTRRFYRADHETVSHVQAELAAMWDDSLARLKTAAENAEHQRRKKVERP